MKRNKLTLLIFILVSTMHFTISKAATYSCTKVDDKAVLGYEGTDVSIVEKNKNCSFSINGASVDGKDSSYEYRFDPAQLEQRLDPNTFLQKVLPNIIRSIELSHGSNNPNISDYLIDRFRSGEVGCSVFDEITSIEQYEVSCELIDPGGAPREISDGGIGLLLVRKNLVIRIKDTSEDSEMLMVFRAF